MTNNSQIPQFRSGDWKLPHSLPMTASIAKMVTTDVITQNLEEVVFHGSKKMESRFEYYNLAGRETQVVNRLFIMLLEWRVWKVSAKTLGLRRGHMDGCYNTLEITAIVKQVYAKMITDKSLEPLLNEFFGLITPR